MGEPGDIERCVYILYTNYRSETAWRRVVPKQLLFKSTPSHPEEQWILKSWDLDKDAERDFAMKDIHKWQMQPPEE